jgi:glyoxylase-like metal-dependent hydrolase (beta-lactamase superfamily II)
MADLLELTPSLYRLRIPGERAHLLNCYLRLDPDGVTLVDTGWPDSAPLIADALAAVDRGPGDVKHVVLTHFHEDHCGAAAEVAGWSGAEVIAGADDSSYIRGEEDGPVPVLTDAERTLRPDFDAAPHGPACRVDRTVSGGDVLDFGGGARVIAVPGHTPGSIALYLPADDAVLTGDAVAELNGQVAVGVFNTDRPAAVRAAGIIAATGAGIAGFGHGEAIVGDAAARIAAAVDLFA